MGDDPSNTSIKFMAKKWYVIHTHSGCENKVKEALLNRTKSLGMEGMISQILIPTEKVSEVKDGEKKITNRKFFPGYVLLEMEMTEKSWYLIRNTPGITGFVGSRKKPVPLDEAEIKNIISQMKEEKQIPKPKVLFELGENVRIIKGPFTNFNGVVDEVYPEKGKLKLTVTVFGRATPVELEYWQVERI